MNRRFLVAGLAFLFCSNLRGGTHAPDSACSTLEVPANALLGDVRVVRGLHGDDFSARGKHERIDIDSLQYDTAARRILLIADNGPRLNADARKAQAQILDHVLSGARPEDSFPFVSARGTQIEVPFGEPRETVQQVVETTLLYTANAGNGDGFLDAVMHGIRLFKDPREGDAIIAMTLEFEKSRSATYQAVAETLAQDHIRMFGFLLGPIMKGAYFTTIGPGAGTVFVPNAQNFSTQWRLCVRGTDGNAMEGIPAVGRPFGGASDQGLADLQRHSRVLSVASPGTRRPEPAFGMDPGDVRYSSKAHADGGGDLSSLIAGL
jgi:hypothetical protein